MANQEKESTQEKYTPEKNTTLENLDMNALNEKQKMEFLEAIRYDICPACGCPANHPRTPAAVFPISQNPPIMFYCCTAHVPYKPERCGNLYIATSSLEELISTKESKIQKPNAKDVKEVTRSKGQSQIIKP